MQMKKISSFILVLVICLSLCACGKQAKIDGNNVDDITTALEQSDDKVIKFEPSIVVAEDQYVRVELVRFYQDYFRWTDSNWPVQANSSTEGATLQNVVVFKFCNKCDHDLYIEMSDVYLENDGAHRRGLEASSREPAAGKNVTGHYLIQTGERESLQSMDELYSLNGEFKISHRVSEGILKDPYSLQFSIPDAVSD